MENKEAAPVMVIDGVRYVREDTILDVVKDAVNIKDEDPTFFRGCVFEDDVSCFEATNLCEVSGKPYGDLEIQFTDKRSGTRESWVEHYMDNEDYLRGLMKEEPECLTDALKFMNSIQLATLRAFLKFLEGKGWFGHGKD